MPASRVMKEFRAGRLHSGSKNGPIVTNEHQARAILISEARKERYKIALAKPERKN